MQTRLLRRVAAMLPKRTGQPLRARVACLQRVPRARRDPIASAKIPDRRRLSCRRALLGAGFSPAGIGPQFTSLSLTRDAGLQRSPAGAQVRYSLADARPTVGDEDIEQYAAGRENGPGDRCIPQYWARHRVAVGRSRCGYCRQYPAGPWGRRARSRRDRGHRAPQPRPDCRHRRSVGGGPDGAEGRRSVRLHRHSRVQRVQSGAD